MEDPHQRRPTPKPDPAPDPEPEFEPEPDFADEHSSTTFAGDQEGGPEQTEEPESPRGHAGLE